MGERSLYDGVQECEKHVSEKAETKKKASEEVVGAIKVLMSAKWLNLNCVRVLHESTLILTLMYGSETSIWEKVRIRVVQMNIILEQ